MALPGRPFSTGVKPWSHPDQRHGQDPKSIRLPFNERKGGAGHQLDVPAGRGP